MASPPQVQSLDILAAARALAPRIRAEAAEIELQRCLSPGLVEALKQGGVYRMPIPRSWGGPELDPLTQIEVIEALSAADGSTGWCVMIGSDGGYWTAFLEDAVGRQLYTDLDAVTASVTRPGGRAVAGPAGYRVSGHWAFASGCQQSAWVVVNAFIYDGETQRRGPDGAPETRMCYLPAADCQIVDTWTTTGLRGSGSHDLAVDDLFVPVERTFNFLTSPIRRTEPLYALRTMYVVNLPGVPLGIARAAIDTLVEQAGQRTTRTGGGLRDEVYVQMAVAKADALLGAARSYVFDVVGDVWSTLQAGGELSVGQRARYRLCVAACGQMCVEVVDLMYQVGGGASLYAENPLDRYLRDVHTTQQHLVHSPKVFEASGRMLLGLEPNLPGY